MSTIDPVSGQLLPYLSSITTPGSIPTLQDRIDNGLNCSFFDITNGETLKVSLNMTNSEDLKHPQVHVPSITPPSWYDMFSTVCQTIVGTFVNKPLIASIGGELPKTILSPNALKEATDNSYKEVENFSHQIERDLAKRPLLYLKEKDQVSEYRFDMEKISPSLATKKAVAEAIIPDEIKEHIKDNSSYITYLSMAVESAETLEWLMTFPWITDAEEAAKMKDDFFITTPSGIKMTVCLEENLVLLEKAERYFIRDMENNIVVGTLDIVRRYNLNELDKSPTYQLNVSS